MLVVECLGASTVILYGINLILDVIPPENEARPPHPQVQSSVSVDKSQLRNMHLVCR